MMLKDLEFGKFQQQFAGLAVIEDDIDLGISAGVNIGHLAVSESLVQYLGPHLQLVGGMEGEIAAGGSRRGWGNGS